jgi:hypothetical protein
MKRKRELEWHVEAYRDICNRLTDISILTNNFGHPDFAGEPSLDDQFRELRAAVDAFEVMCRQRASAPPIVRPSETDVP